MKPFTVSGLKNHTGQMLRQRPRSGIGTRAKSTRGGVILTAKPETKQPKHPWELSPRWTASGWVAYVFPGFLNGEEVEIRGVSLIAKDKPALPLTGWRLDRNPPKDFDRELINGNEVYRCSVWLDKPRAAMRQSIEVLNPSASGATFQISATIQGASGPAQIRCGQYEPERQPSDEEFLTGTAQETNSDTIKLADVFAVSEPGDGVTAAARIRVRYSVFWNLMHASPEVPRELDNEPFTLTVPLAGGIGQSAVNLALARDNDAREKALAYLNRFRRAGAFWSV